MAHNPSVIRATRIFGLAPKLIRDGARSPFPRHRAKVARQRHRRHRGTPESFLSGLNYRARCAVVNSRKFIAGTGERAVNFSTIFAPRRCCRKLLFVGGRGGGENFMQSSRSWTVYAAEFTNLSRERSGTIFGVYRYTLYINVTDRNILS